MRVTERDQELLVKLAACRWLMTSQIKALCFPDVSVEMARRRLRLLAHHHYVRTWRTGRLSEALHVLGPEGRRLLLARGSSRELRLERRPPRHFEHSFAINDLRIWVEQYAQREGLSVGFFYACWELPVVGWRFSLIPDAVCLLEEIGRRLTLAFEFDRGEEGLGYILRRKLRPYACGLAGLPISRVIVVTETEVRAAQLQRYAHRHNAGELFCFTSLKRLLQGDVTEALILSELEPMRT